MDSTSAGNDHDTLHVCRLNHAWANSSIVRTMPQFFSVSEQAKYERLPTAQQNQYRLSRTLIRLALQQRFGQTFDHWQLTEQTDKAPQLIDASQPCSISLSHSKDYMACALSSNPIGVDIEQNRETKHQDKVARRVFTLDQQQALNSTDNTQQKDQLFLRFWCEKEAIFKACSAAGQPITFMSPDSAKNTPFDHTTIQTRKFTLAIAQSKLLSPFKTYFWRSPQQNRLLACHQARH